MLTLATSRLCGYRGDRHIALAAAVEFIHTATLLHDDVVDDSDPALRGLATANAVWGNKASVLVGDFLFSRGVRADGRGRCALGALDPVARLGDHRRRRGAAARHLEQCRDHRSRLSRSDQRQDGAQLFAAASRIGAVVASRNEADERALESYGRNLGIAFQLIDDLLDYSARQAELGKTVGDDFREGKITLPVVLAVRAADDREREFWRRTLGRQRAARRRSPACDRTDAPSPGTLAATLERAREHGTAARRSLATFRDCPERQALDEVIEFCLERGY